MFPSICDWGDDGCADEADDDENSAGDAGFIFTVAVWREDLVEEGGDAVEERDVGGEWDEDEPEFEGREELADCLEERSFVFACCGCGGTRWCGGFGWDEE